MANQTVSKCFENGKGQTRQQLSPLESEVVSLLRDIPAYDRVLIRDTCRTFRNEHKAGRLFYGGHNGSK